MIRIEMIFYFSLCLDNKFIEGTKINSPHYLSKLNLPKGHSKYIVVVSQYEKMNTIYYSLRVS